jgi:hypothetical protein
MSGQFTRGPMDVGFSQTPHGLWTLNVSTGARVLLGWLHSHTDTYLASVTVNMAKRVFNTSTISKWLDELGEAGFLTVTKGGNGKADSFALHVEPWVALFGRRRHRAETGSVPVAAPADRAEVGAPESAPVVDQVEEIKEIFDAPVTSSPTRRPVGARQTNDALFQSMVIACGMSYAEMTERQRKSCAVAMAELRRVDATPEEVERRAVIYRQMYDAVLTPNALASQWAMLKAAPPPSAGPTRQTAVDAGIEKYLANQRPPADVIHLRGRSAS